jgi:hypothetical protein
MKSYSKVNVLFWWDILRKLAPRVTLTILKIKGLFVKGMNKTFFRRR